MKNRYVGRKPCRLSRMLGPQTVLSYSPLSFLSLLFQNLVVKPDQLIKRRGKLGLVGVNLTLEGVKSWLKPRLGQEATVSTGVGWAGGAVVTEAGVVIPRGAAVWLTTCSASLQPGEGAGLAGLPGDTASLGVRSRSQLCHQRKARWVVKVTPVQFMGR